MPGIDGEYLTGLAKSKFWQCNYKIAKNQL